MKKEVKKTTEKYVTIPIFEKAMVSIARSFDRIEGRLVGHDKAFQLLFKQMQVYTEEAREHRQTMASLMHADIRQERDMEDLKTRIERLEMQIK